MFSIMEVLNEFLFDYFAVEALDDLIEALKVVTTGRL